MRQSKIMQNASVFLCLIVIGLLTSCDLAQEATTAKNAQTSSNTSKSILVSIRPLALILRDLFGSTYDIQTLVSLNTNPHFYQIKPSDVLKLKKAERFYWVGPQLESYLPRLLERHHVRQSSLYMLDPELAVTLNNHRHSVDAHIWLDAPLVRSIAEKMFHELNGNQLSKDEQNQEKLMEFIAKLEHLIDSQRQRFAKPSEVLIISQHDAFSRLARATGFHIDAFLSASPEIKPTVAKLAEIQNLLKQDRHVCFLKNVNESDTYTKRFKNPKLKVVELDILASKSRLNEGYVEFLGSLLNQIHSCLY